MADYPKWPSTLFCIERNTENFPPRKKHGMEVKSIFVVQITKKSPISSINIISLS